MDPLYNKEQAIKALQKATQERHENTHSGLQVVQMFSGKVPWSSYTAIQVGATWRLVYCQAAGEDVHAPEEVVASLQGIICNADLPPFRERISVGSKQIKYIRQGVTLTAFGDSAFDVVVAKIAEVHAFFGRIVGTDRLQACTMSTTFDGTAAVEMSNRYFTPKKNGPDAAAGILLGEDIDPHGHLTRAAGTGYVHTEDNQVHYYERQVKSEEDHRFIPTAPVTFQVGDVVEVQVSFAVLPLRYGKLKSSLILRSITLLDGSVSQAAAVLKLSSTIIKASDQPRVTLKRRVGYVEEEVSATRAKLVHLEINEKELEESRSVEVALARAEEMGEEAMEIV